MGRFLGRIVGIALIIAGIAGLVFSIVGLVVLIQVQKNVEAAVASQLGLVDQALTATSQGLGVAEDSLAQAVDTVKVLETTVSGIGTTINSSVPVVETISSLVGEKLPAAIETTQKTLVSVAASSKTVDDLLAVMSAIPFLGVARYSPDVPLSQGFQEVATSLEGIPDALRAAKEQLLTTNQNLAGLQGQFDAMASNIGQIATSVGGAQSVLGQYTGVIGQLQSSIGWMRQSLPMWLGWVRLGLSLLLIWLGIAQLALITQGWELVGRSRRKRAQEAEAAVQ